MIFQAPQSGAYEWLNRIIAIGHGERRTDSVHLTVYEVR